MPVAAKGEGQTVREYRLDGKLSLINLTRANFDVGTMVQKVSEADPGNFKILAIDESSNQVSLEAENCSVDTVTFSDLLDNYKETKRVKEVLLLSKDIPPPKMTDADIDWRKVLSGSPSTTYGPPIEMGNVSTWRQHQRSECWHRRH